MADLIAGRSGLPGCRRVPGLTLLTLQRVAGDRSAAAAAQALGLPWPAQPGQLLGQDPWLAWRSPQETLLFAADPAPARALLAALAPGRSATAMAAELSDALVVVELHGPRIDEWLEHLMDASAIVREPGRCSRGRLADTAVLLLRLQAQRLWLAADAPLAAYVENWLHHAHDGAFGAAP